jgi:hypothetical protein
MYKENQIVLDLNYKDYKGLGYGKIVQNFSDDSFLVKFTNKRLKVMFNSGGRRYDNEKDKSKKTKLKIFRK